MENTIQKSNNLVYVTSRIVGKERINVTIRLNDECKNGHQDFAITGDIYEANKPKLDHYHIAGGCIHEEILKVFPEFKIFVELHLCDWEGIPTYCAANGFYHLVNGFSNTEPTAPNFKVEFCNYYRLTPEQFDVLKTSRNKIQYALNLEKLGVFSQWKKQANEAINLLQELTGKEFYSDSIRSQYDKPTAEQVKEEQERVINGYYSKEATEQREQAKKDASLNKLEAEQQKKINDINTEYSLKKQVLVLGGEKALSNCIYYNHTKKLVFNWKGYESIPVELVNKIIAGLIVPEGVTVGTEK